MRTGNDIKRFNCKKGFIDRFHYNTGNVPEKIVFLGWRDRDYGTAFRLNGEGEWYDSSCFDTYPVKYLHFKELFSSDAIWSRAKRELV